MQETMQLLKSFLRNAANIHQAHPNLPQQNKPNWDFPSVVIAPSSFPHIREKNSQENK
jgi:hypothetical protein